MLHCTPACTAMNAAVRLQLMCVLQVSRVLGAWAEGIKRGSISPIAQQRLYSELNGGSRGTEKPYAILPGKWYTFTVAYRYSSLCTQPTSQHRMCTHSAPQVYQC
jgi:hypothetical protein